MFPDSQLSAIRCGRTNASYFVFKAIAPFCREELTVSLSDKLHSLYVDKTTYNGKVRLEIRVTFVDNNDRTSRYLFTSQLSVDVDINDFLESNIQSLKTCETSAFIENCE